MYSTIALAWLVLRPLFGLFVPEPAAYAAGAVASVGVLLLIYRIRGRLSGASRAAR